MEKTRAQLNKRGFTLAETLMTVGILAVLFSLIFVGVMHYMRAMAQLERDGIAKEIFVSAQNHLTMAESQGYLGKTGFGRSDRSGGESAETYYFLVNGPESFSEDSVLGLMLPYASVEETVRTGNSYLVRYQREPAQVLDVFYCTRTGTRFGMSIGDGDFSGLMAVRDTEGANRKQARRSYGQSRAVVGWYGGEEALNLEKGAALLAPEIEIVNAERLLIRVKDTNNTPVSSLRLVVRSGEHEKSFLLSRSEVTMRKYLSYDELSCVYTLTADDVTEPGLHFAELFSDAGFVPGEDITVQAVAFSSKVLTNIAFSAEKTANSLYAEVTEAEGGSEAAVANIRHLENLDPSVSGVNSAGTGRSIEAARQISDLSWPEFQEKIGRSVSVFRRGESSGTSTGCYLPVTPRSALAYDGQSHTVTGIQTNDAGDAGLFGALPDGSGVKDLLLEDFEIRGSGNAGALAGTAVRSEITNVLAKGVSASVTGGRNAGGLIGASDGCSLNGAAAALFVRSTGGSAGGLIGSAGGGELTGCYAAGHTTEGVYGTGDSDWNVTATGSAGGLLGSASGTSVSACYATCSVSGGTSGGFLGSGSGTLSDCYAAGPVATGGSSAGAFAGSFSGSAGDCQYLEILNERTGENGKLEYLTALGGGGTEEGIAPADDSLESYTAFAPGPESSDSASPYDGVLIRRYQGKYSFRTVNQLGAGLDEKAYAAVHHGDWPSPELFVVNQ
jgi:prepilin-type N-terminal cleavage/methylation domain-containing protein